MYIGEITKILNKNLYLIYVVKKRLIVNKFTVKNLFEWKRITKSYGVNNSHLYPIYKVTMNVILISGIILEFYEGTTNHL